MTVDDDDDDEGTMREPEECETYDEMVWKGRKCRNSEVWNSFSTQGPFINFMSVTLITKKN